MNEEKIILKHNIGEYPIIIGKSLFEKTCILETYIKGKQIMIVTNPTVAKFYLFQVKSLCEGYDVSICELPDGEAHKTFDSYLRIIDQLIQTQHHRDTTLIALGGGVIGDITGFAAATYQRGVAFLQIPTTLLAQVDASVGGKTAINHPLGKNMVGAFHQPTAVLINIDTLNTLPNREFTAGIAEIIKSAMLADAEFFIWLEKHIDQLQARDPDTLIYAIKRSCEIKRDIVAQDERETSKRALLNLGHTFAHAIEHSLGYGTWLHGEAVALGLLMATDLSITLGLIDSAQYDRVLNLVTRCQLPTHLPADTNCATLMAALQHDKKILNGKLRFIVLQAMGEAIIKDDIADTIVLASIQRHS